MRRGRKGQAARALTAPRWGGARSLLRPAVLALLLGACDINLAELDRPDYPEYDPVRVVLPGLAFTDVSGGSSRLCALDDGGTPYCWNQWQAEPNPLPVHSSQSFETVAVSGSHACALTATGEAYCWGENYAGQLGDGGSAPRSAPFPVQTPETFVDIDVRVGGTCAITSAGALYCWGATLTTSGEMCGQYPCTVGDSVPQRRAEGFAFRSISMGDVHSCATIATADALYCWGYNDSGQLGDGTLTPRAVPTPVATQRRFLQVSAGESHTCALDVDGAVLCWGQNSLGQVGVDRAGTGPDVRPQPQLVPELAAAMVVRAGADMSCALTRDGSAWCWGANGGPELGTGSAYGDASPAPVLTDLTFHSLANSGHRSCAIGMDDRLYCWGYDGF